MERQYTDYNRRRTNPTSRAKNLFMNISIFCGTAIVLAVTVKVIISLF